MPNKAKNTIPHPHRKNPGSAENYARRRREANALRPKQRCIVLGPGECYWTREDFKKEIIIS